MQAAAKYDFVANERDELSFSQGAIVKIISMEDDANWYTAELHGRIGYVPKTYIDIKPHPWFAGKTSRSQAERILLAQWSDGTFKQPDGAFLVRYCESSPGDISISVKHEGTCQHYKVLRDGNGKYFLWIVKFDSVNELIDYHRTSSVSRNHNLPLRDMVKSPTFLIGQNRSGATAAISERSQTTQMQFQPPNAANPVPQHNTKGQYAVALYDFEPQEDGEIALKRGCTVKINSQYDDNWLLGECNGHSGLFPASYVAHTPW
ncbi:hypothetical protein ACOME3_009383 [Neoechinorhynchus agilis]